jgi:membrane dipeptidase
MRWFGRPKLRHLLWLLFITALVAIGFFGIGPSYVDQSMNSMGGTRPPAAPQPFAWTSGEGVIDLHSDQLLWARDVLKPATRGHVDLRRLEQGQFLLQVFSSVTRSPYGLNYERNRADTFDMLVPLSVAQRQPPRTWISMYERSIFHAEKLKRFANQSNGRLRVIESRADLDRLVLDRAASQRVTGALLSIEGLHNLEGQFENLDQLYAAGFRMAGLAHFFDTEISGSAHGERQYGLTPLGRRVVARMEERGMMIDLAHASPRTIDEVLALSTRPVVVSHGGVRAICNNVRNLSDDQIRRIATKGGVIGVGFWDAAVCKLDPLNVMKSMAHIRDLVGVQAVALGSDWDGAVTTMVHPGDMDALAAAMRDHGFTVAETRAILGGNALRFLRAGLVPVSKGAPRTNARVPGATHSGHPDRPQKLLE